MLALCETIHCRRRHLLSYFGQNDTSTTQSCGNCDVCISPPIAFDASIVTQQLLSAIYRVDQRFAAGHVIDVLRGMDSERIQQWRHNKLSTYGIGSERSEAEWRAILRQAIAQGYVNVDYESYNALKLTETARSVLKGEQSVQMRRYEKPQKPSKQKRTTTKGYEETDLSAKGQQLFEKLRSWRMETARLHNVPAYVIFHDSTLRDIAKANPSSLADLRGVSGVGEKKLVTYGEQIVELVTAFG